MRISCVKNGLVIVVILLFIGVSVVSAIDCVYTNERIFTVNTINKHSISEDKLLSDYTNTLYNLTVNITTDKTVYKRFEPVEITLSVTNNGNENWTHTFPDSQFADFDINSYYRWSRDKCFFLLIWPITIPSGETVVLLKTYWHQFTNWYNNGWILRLPVSPGNYTIRGWIALTGFPTPPFGYSNITITRFISKSVQQNCENNNFFQYNKWLFKPFLERFPLLERLLNLLR